MPVLLGQKLALVTLAGGGEAQGQSALSGQARRLQQDVVALLRPEVGHGHGQQVPVGHAQLGPDPAPDLVSARHHGPGGGQVHPVHHHPGARPEGAGERLVGGVGHGDEGAVAGHRGPVEQLDQWGDLVPETVLGVHGDRSAVAGQGQDDQATQGRGVRQMEMDDGVAVVEEEAPERGQPSEVEAPLGPEVVDRGSAVPQFAGQRVGSAEHEGHLELERPVVARGHGVHEQAFGAAVAQALDGQQDRDRPR